MLEFLTSVGFRFPETGEYTDKVIEMLTYYEQKDSQLLPVADGHCLLLRAEPLQMLFSADAQGNADIQPAQLIYPTDHWQPVAEAYWMQKELATVVTQYGISVNVLVPEIYQTDTDGGCQLEAACFALAAEACTEEEFRISHPTRAPMSTINSGSFAGDSSCSVSGYITDVRLCHNDYSHCDYYHITLRCEDLTLDVLVGAGDLKGQPQPGAVITAQGWITGRFRPDSASSQ